MRMKLVGEALQNEVARIPQWTLRDGELVREVKFEDFKQAMTFVNRVAFQAEVSDHHPDIDIRYNRVVLVLVTHDAGGITTSDIEMAAKIDEIS